MMSTTMTMSAFFQPLGGKKHSSLRLMLDSDALRVVKYSKTGKAQKQGQEIPIEMIIGARLAEVSAAKKKKNHDDPQRHLNSIAVQPLELSRKEIYGSRFGLCQDLSHDDESTLCLRIDYFKTRRLANEVDDFRVKKMLLKLFQCDQNDARTEIEIVKQWSEQIMLRVEVYRRQGNCLNRKRRCLVMLNPKSGTGIALKLFRSKVEPMMKMAGMKYDLLITKRQGHARDLVGTMNTERWSSVVIVSGDGLFYEVLQGLMTRPDWQTCLDKIPLNIIAGGSGNGLARSLCHEESRSYRKNGVISSVKALLASRYKPMDVMYVESKSGFQCYTFLSVGMGYFSDVDVESERLRFLGEPRFTVYGVFKIFTLKPYEAVITFKQVKDKCSIDSKESVKGNIFSEHTLDTTDEVDAIKFDRQISENSLSSDSFEQDDDLADTSELPLNRSPDIWLPSFSDSLPESDGWTRLQGQFNIIYAVNVAYIGADLKVAPSAKSDDGFIWLFLVSEAVSKPDFAKIVSSLESESHLKHPAVKVFPVSAFRLEPRSRKQGRITVDGELMPHFEPIQVQILPGFLKIIN